MSEAPMVTPISAAVLKARLKDAATNCRHVCVYSGDDLLQVSAYYEQQLRKLRGALKKAQDSVRAA